MQVTYTRKNKTNTTLLLLIGIFILIFISTLNSTSIPLKPFGLASISFVLVGSVYMLFFFLVVQQKISKIQLIIFIAAIPFISLLFIGLFNNPSSRGLIALFQFTTVIGFFLFSSLIKWDEKKVKFARRLTIFLFLFVLPLTADLSLIGAYVAFALFFILLKRKSLFANLVLSLTSLVIIYLSEARAVFILLLAAAVTYFFWNRISKTKFRFILFFTLIMAAIMGFIFIYPNLIYWSNFYTINDFVRTYTGGNLMSGRNTIWLTLLELINQKPLLGYGTGVLVGDITEFALSAHNLYLQTTIQNGYIGLTFLIILFFVIWLQLFKSKNEYNTRLSAAFFIGILVYQSFEVVLTQNKMDTALMQWLIISVGISSSIYNVKKQT
ncbi:O-antigen ligase family protein [Fictibacillus phosphorivorans]|uniref:O-antigen ligase family protein n=1 Tax=Fictibacillus phosphorivorans TaxID=1221500 RepID=UPI0035F0DA60